MSQAGPLTRPAGRYGRSQPPSRRTMSLVGGILVISLTAWVGWIAVAGSGTAVRYAMLSDSVVGPGRTDVTFQITMDPGERAVCTVRARNANLTVVGWVDVPVGPSADRTFTASVRVPTMEQASGGEVKACVLA